MHTLILDPHQSTISAPGSPVATIAIGVEDITTDFFLTEAPTSLQFERAIDAVEEALEATGLKHAHRGELLTADASLASLPGLQTEGAWLARDQVEALFRRVTTSSPLHAGAFGVRALDRRTAAALLILRECMHHLGYDAIRRFASHVP